LWCAKVNNKRSRNTERIRHDFADEYLPGNAQWRLKLKSNRHRLEPFHLPNAVLKPGEVSTNKPRLSRQISAPKDVFDNVK
jgi:hypothetical protein